VRLFIQGQERTEDAQLVAWRQKRDAAEAERKKENQEDSVESYERAFHRIKEITGEDDLDLLVNKFIEVEDRNFALFNYVNEQNNEIEMLQEQIAQVIKIHFSLYCSMTKQLPLVSLILAINKQTNITTSIVVLPYQSDGGRN